MQHFLKIVKTLLSGSNIFSRKLLTGLAASEMCIC